MMDKLQSFIAFEILHWCGLRCGELLALTPNDIDLKKKTISVTKTYHRIQGKDVTTPPKTPKSVRTIVMSEFLAGGVKDYLRSFKGINPDERIIPVTSSFLHHEMDRGVKRIGVKRIRIHDLRHSHVSLLIELNYSALAIADRLGHESTEVAMRYAHLFPSK